MNALLERGPVTSRQRKTLAQRVADARVKADMTQQQLAFAAGTSVGLIASIEQGKDVDPKLSTLRKIAKALGVAVPDLLPDAEE